MIPFKTIRARAEKRKGGPKGLAKLLPEKPDAKALAKLPDDRILAEMTKRVFCAGFAWSVIEQKWPDFEKAFLGFKPAKLAFQPDEFWGALMDDKRSSATAPRSCRCATTRNSCRRLPKNTAALASS